MKRGLVVLDHDELPEEEWRRRIDRTRAGLREQGVDLALVYGDVFRSDDIAYLTNLCIYWNEGMLAVPANGEPALLTKLSPRVHTWMRRTSTLTDLRSGKAFGSLVGALLAERAPGTLGLIDAELWPAALVEEVTGAATGWTVRPLPGLVRESRTRPSEHEVALLRRSGAVLAEAVERAGADGLAERERVATAEEVLRGQGFTDVVARAGATSVEITGQYRNAWLRTGRTLHGELADPLAAALGTAAGGVTTRKLAEAARSRLGEPPADAVFDLRVIDHVDLATDGEYLGQDGDRALVAGQVAVVVVELVRADGTVLTASDSVLVGERGATALTRAAGDR
jgi:hypothetical protein